ncbi:hypothetical protein A9404_09430 [Halothiobacillus diazotrophicus]|uniref:PRC-barrel domain-containing protein n=1 Tax=Halothiobacillus diazotrophicus TaxID=1860122 RepID=A0A191ZIA8_9GAMM|nr:PRC-barrel domain-containing protein [Halothiobacillus diazotrophicus]ANJ67583.1 hypothetical protein A9404_09430 [Halothiobacillus diazotrophicus]
MNTMIQKTTIAVALCGAIAFTVSPLADAAEGLYSTKALMGAEVYVADGKHREIGEVSNIFLDENMRVAGVVVTTGAVLGLGGKDVYVPAGQFSVKTEHATQLNGVAYKVYVDATEQGVGKFPVVDQDWWSTTKRSAAHAWEKTKSGLKSGWEGAKHVTTKAYDATKDAAEDAVDAVKDKTK